MKRRNFIKLTGYGGVGLVGSVSANHAVATTSSSELSDLPNFDFATVKVDRTGQEIQRTYHRALLYTEDLGHYRTLEMVSIPAGKFNMGASLKEKESSDRERPLHSVRVASFFLGKYPVTQGQWRAVAQLAQVKRELNPNPSHFKGENRPVECVSWLDAMEFCARLSAHTGKQYRLPSEAEWEYACRGNSNSPFAYGDTVTGNLADYASTFAYAVETGVPYRQQTIDVGSFMPNVFGLYDLHGNVREWCADVWHDNYHGSPYSGKAWIKGGKSECRILRGGSWANKPSHCRSAHRSGYPAESLNRAIGFRVAMNL